MSEHTHSKKKNSLIHIIVLALIVVLAVWLALVTIQTNGPGTEWSCIQQVCAADEPGGELWAQQNCGVVNDPETGQDIEVCQVSINGQTQLIPRAEINLSAIRNCVEFACVQEVRVREVNYTLEPATP